MKLQKRHKRLLMGSSMINFIVDPIQGGAGTSMNMNTNEVIANSALERMGMKKGICEN